MDLKYYLRGLGLGIIVTAVIMGVVLGGKNKSMTDDDVRKRAAELGMVDGNSRLVEEDQTAEELLEELNASEDNPEDAIADDSDNENLLDEADAFLNDDPDKKSDSEEIAQPEAVAEETTETVEENSEPIEIQEEPQEEVQEESEEEVQESTPAGDMVSFSISSGESSYTVAKKLEAAGLVPNASDYDTYLCQYGYDRYIRTGSFEVRSGASDEEIAKLITGK